MSSLLLKPCQKLSSPYINRFLQPDNIVPNLSNPQSLNRYAYVRNSPLRFNDPTGHREELGNMGNQKKVDCKKSAQYCSNGVPKTSEELLNMRYPKKTETPKPWELKLNANIGYHIGGALDGPMPDYYGETENSANVPYVSDVIPSNQNLMLCSGGTQALGCLFSLGASLLPYQYGPPNTDSNYFVSFQVNYNEASGVTMSDVYWANHYEGQAILRQIKIGKEVKLVDSVYMPTDGQYRPIVESGASFDGSKPVWIEIAIDTWISGPNGSGTFREPLPPIIIPSLQGVKDYMQR